jgi:hypothetical protein
MTGIGGGSCTGGTPQLILLKVEQLNLKTVIYTSSFTSSRGDR